MSKKKKIFESVNRKPGENIAQLMSDVTFKNDDIAVEELICNGYDADAETVYIFFDKKNEVLKVFDDGTGMGKRGIEAFYRVGDSEKVSKKRTKKGRIPIGDRGIATLAIAFLSNNYTLETISSGEKRTVTEDVSEGVGDCSKNIKFPVEKVRNQKNGTKISMKGLKALKEGRDFSLEGLVKSIGNNMPIAPDFKVFVNDKEVKSRKIEKATEYFFDIKTPSAGRVSGSFFLCSSTIKDQRERGVFIRVNGRVVGDPNYFNLAHIKGAFGSKMVGFIEANGLDDCIGVDRSRFQTGSRKFREVEGVIREILGTISTDYKREMESSEVKRARALLESKIKELCGTFGLRGIKLGSYKDTQASRFDDGGKTLYINANRIYAASLSDQRICSEIEEAVIQAVAKKELLLKYKDSKALEEFENLLTLTRTRLMTNTKTFSELMKEGEKKSLEKRALNEYRLYTDKEMEALRGVPYLITRRLIKSGALREIKPEKFLAKDFSECIKQMKGYTPVYEILRQIVTANVEEDITDREASLAITATEQSVVRQLANAELPEYIKDLGKGSQNFFIIRNDSIENFKKLVSSESLYKRQVSRKSAVRIGTDNEESLDTSVDEAEPKKIECGWSKNNPLSFDPTKDGYKRGMFITTDRGVGKIVMEHPGNKIEVKYPGLDKTVLYKFNVE